MQLKVNGKKMRIKTKSRHSFTTKIAIFLRAIRIPYRASIDIGENYTRGYGKLNNYGFFRFQLPYEHVESFIGENNG